jgi:uncharacterized membrane protein
MRWTDDRLAALEVVDGFRMRGVDTSRLENFCDAAYAFAVTLLVVAGGAIPTSYAALLTALNDVPAFLCSFVAIAVIWLAHRQWSRRYGLEDGWTTLLSLAMVFVMLVYVYPLRMVASAFMAFASGGRLPSTFVMTRAADLTGLFVVYGLGFALQTAMLAALHLLAARADGLRLDAVERLRTRHGVVANGVMAATGVASALAAALLPAHLGIWAGFVYPTLIVTMPAIAVRYRREAERLRHAARPNAGTGQRPRP